MPVELKIRDIRTGEAQIAQWERLDECVAWLADRPRFIEVLGPPERDAIPAADEQAMRAAVRPLDDEERAAQIIQDQRDAEVVRAALADHQARAEAQIAALRERNALADPERPLEVIWERGHGCRNADPADPREPTAPIRAAVEAWVRERETWVHPRGQYLVDARVVAWPGPIPGGDEADRIEPGGQFNTLSGSPDDP